MVLVSSVIRGTNLGESHGGLYLVDLERNTAALALDWNRTDIDIGGRGGDRGLRGIAFHRSHILVAANASLVVLDRDFHLIDSFTNPYLKHCHEICVWQDRVYVTATGYDAVLIFDLAARRFVHGWHLDLSGKSLQLISFDPNDARGPAPGHRFHLNSITVAQDGVRFSGLHTPGLLHTDGNSLSLAAPLPHGTHNAQMLGAGLVYNDTEADRVCYRSRTVDRDYAVPRYRPGAILHSDRLTSDIARPGFARGLCVVSADLIAAGSSPSTVSLYDLRSERRIAQCTVSMDVRNAVHGLALWPF
jgi:hypothetical protein